MYQIRKGWPSNGAIDEVFKAASGVELKEGMIVQLNADHEAIIAASNDGKGALAFVIGAEAQRKTWTGLLSQCVIECDAEHYEEGAYTGGAKVTVANGKFKLSNDSTGADVIGRVLAYDANTGMLRVLWYESK